MVVSKLLDRGLVALTLLSATLTLVEQAFAGPGEVVAAVPAPIIGAGLSGLAILGGVYGAIGLVRNFRNSRRT